MKPALPLPNGMHMIKKDKVHITLPQGKKAYFLSDWHLGWPDPAESRKRERKIVQWLREIEEEAAALFLVGDIFDFWFDYRHAVPKYFTRILGQLAHMSDKEIEIHYFFGNHDMWIKDYFEAETGMHIHSDAVDLTLNQLKIFIAHGDGLGPGDRSYKFLKKIFRNPLAQWLYGWLHPDLGIPLASFFSKSSRASTPGNITDFHGPGKEHLMQFSEQVLVHEHYDYFIFGHRHHAADFPLSNRQSRYINLGDWIKWFSYAESDGNKVELKILSGKKAYRPETTQ